MDAKTRALVEAKRDEFVAKNSSWNDCPGCNNKEAGLYQGWNACAEAMDAIARDRDICSFLDVAKVPTGSGKKTEPGVMSDAENIEQKAEAWSCQNSGVTTKVEAFKAGVEWRDQNPKPPADDRASEFFRRYVGRWKPPSESLVLGPGEPQFEKQRDDARAYGKELAQNLFKPAESDENLRDALAESAYFTPQQTERSEVLAQVFREIFKQGWDAARANPDPRVAELVEAARGVLVELHALYSQAGFGRLDRADAKDDTVKSKADKLAAQLEKWERKS